MRDNFLPASISALELLHQHIFMLWRCLFFLHLTKQHLIASNFFYSFLTSQFSENWRELRPYFGWDFGLKECCDWGGLLSCPLKSFPSSTRWFCFLIISVFIGVALLISFKNFSLALTSWLSVWHMSPRYGAISAFNTLNLLCLIISSFWFKVRDLALFLSLEHLDVIVGILIGLISMLLCLREYRSLSGGREMGE